MNTALHSLPEIDPHGENLGKLFLGADCWHYSYKTIMAYKGPRAPEGVRCESPSRTTSKHLGQLGSAAWRLVSDEEFERIAGVQS